MSSPGLPTPPQIPNLTSPGDIATFLLSYAAGFFFDAFLLDGFEAFAALPDIQSLTFALVFAFGALGIKKVPEARREAIESRHSEIQERGISQRLSSDLEEQIAKLRYLEEQVAERRLELESPERKHERLLEKDRVLNQLTSDGIRVVTDEETAERNSRIGFVAKQESANAEKYNEILERIARGRLLWNLGVIEDEDFEQNLDELATFLHREARMGDLSLGWEEREGENM